MLNDLYYLIYFNFLFFYYKLGNTIVFWYLSSICWYTNGFVTKFFIFYFDYLSIVLYSSFLFLFFCKFISIASLLSLNSDCNFYYFCIFYYYYASMTFLYNLDTKALWLRYLYSLSLFKRDTNLLCSSLLSTILLSTILSSLLLLTILVCFLRYSSYFSIYYFLALAWIAFCSS